MMLVLSRPRKHTTQIQLPTKIRAVHVNYWRFIFWLLCFRLGYSLTNKINFHYVSDVQLKTTRIFLTPVSVHRQGEALANFLTREEDLYAHVVAFIKFQDARVIHDKSPSCLVMWMRFFFQHKRPYAIQITRKAGTEKNKLRYRIWFVYLHSVVYIENETNPAVNKMRNDETGSK